MGKKKMKNKNVSLIVGLVVFIFTSSQVCIAADDEWSDNDPCGMNVEQAVSQSTYTAVDDEWSDYDPCGMNVEEDDSNLHISTINLSGSSRS